MMKDTDSKEVKYKGLMVDMLARIAEMANFDYKIYITEAYGWQLNDTHWNGMIGEVQSKVILNDHVYMYRKLLNNKVKGVKPSWRLHTTPYRNLPLGILREIILSISSYIIIIIVLPLRDLYR